MKTPREILFTRHRSAESKLDALREETVAAVCDRRPVKVKPLAVTARRHSVGISFWRELILPRPRAWAGLAAMWVVIIALKLSTHDPSRIVADRSSASPEVLAELRQQKHLYIELAGIPPVPD